MEKLEFLISVGTIIGRYIKEFLTNIYHSIGLDDFLRFIREGKRFIVAVLFCSLAISSVLLAYYIKYQHLINRWLDRGQGTLPSWEANDHDNEVANRLKPLMELLNGAHTFITIELEKNDNHVKSNLKRIWTILEDENLIKNYRYLQHEFTLDEADRACYGLYRDFFAAFSEEDIKKHKARCEYYAVADFLGCQYVKVAQLLKNPQNDMVTLCVTPLPQGRRKIIAVAGHKRNYTHSYSNNVKRYLIGEIPTFFKEEVAN